MTKDSFTGFYQGNKKERWRREITSISVEISSLILLYIYIFLLCTLSSREELSWICMIFRERSQCLLVVQEKSTACDDAFVLANPFGIWVVYLALQHK